jgi:hypothetical protein
MKYLMLIAYETGYWETLSEADSSPQIMKRTPQPPRSIIFPSPG